MASQLPDGVYTIVQVPNDLATLRSDDPGADVVLLPPSVEEAPSQRVGSISYSHSRIRSHNVLFSRPVGGQKNTKGNVYHN
jgi:hypothetical protein